MEEIKISIPNELKELALMNKINWQLLLTRKLNEEIEKLSKMESIVAKSKLSEEDVQELTDETNIALSKRYQELLKLKRK